MKKSMGIIIILFISFFVFGCSLITGKGDAEKVAESLFKERIENGGFGSTTYYSELFWKNTDKEKWESLSRLVDKAMGYLKGYKLNTWNVKTQANRKELSGTFVYLMYDTIYEKGNGTEQITLYKPLSGDRFTIIGHRFNSPEIQKLIDRGIEHVVSSENL